MIPLCRLLFVAFASPNADIMSDPWDHTPSNEEDGKNNNVDHLWEEKESDDQNHVTLWMAKEILFAGLDVATIVQLVAMSLLTTDIRSVKMCDCETCDNLSGSQVVVYPNSVKVPEQCHHHLLPPEKIVDKSYHFNSVMEFCCLRCLSNLINQRGHSWNKLEDMQIVEVIIRGGNFGCLQLLLQMSEMSDNQFEMVQLVTRKLNMLRWKVPFSILPMLFGYHMNVPSFVLWRCLERNNRSELLTLAACFEPNKHISVYKGDEYISVRVLIKSWAILNDCGIIPDLLKIIMLYNKPTNDPYHEWCYQNFVHL